MFRLGLHPRSGDLPTHPHPRCRPASAPPSQRRPAPPHPPGGSSTLPPPSPLICSRLSTPSFPSLSAARGGATSPPLPGATCGRLGRGLRTWRGRGAGGRTDTSPRTRSPSPQWNARGAGGAGRGGRGLGRAEGGTRPGQPLSARRARLPSNGPGSSGPRRLPRPALPFPSLARVRVAVPPPRPAQTRARGPPAALRPALQAEARGARMGAGGGGSCSAWLPPSFPSTLHPAMIQ